MALLRGEPRTANVVAREESEVLEIGYDAMKDLLSSNPALVESLSEVIAERRAKLSTNSANTPSNVAESGEHYRFD
jgi:CRP-like cAMP-binding protein